MRRMLAAVSASVLVVTGLLSQVGAAPASASARAGRDPSLRRERIAFWRKYGYLVPDVRSYLALKAAADRSPAAPTSPAARTGRAPVVGASWEGQFDTPAPPDTTGAIGPNSYIEPINSRFGIYSRTGTLISQGDLGQLTGVTLGCLSDPQILWDASQKRFYYALISASALGAGCVDELVWGYSKNANPQGPSDFCKYATTDGYAQGTILDYPKLGSTKDFLLVGINRFGGPLLLYQGSDLLWVNRTAATSSCPPGSSFGTGTFKTLMNADGTKTWTPVPSVMTDVTRKGFVTGTRSGSGSYLSVFGVSPSSTTPATPVLSSAFALTVPSYSSPPSGLQCQTTKRLDTLDGRLEHAVAARDPNRGNRMQVWTAHAVSGGLGVEARWYEIDVSKIIQGTGGPSLAQSGKATSATLDVWNAAIAPDRTVSGSGSAHGGNMAMTFTTGSSTECTAVQVVSKVGLSPQSGFTLLKQSPGPNVDDTCSPCRWGDYAGASADPAASLTSSEGGVWITNEWNVASVDNGRDSRTWNAQITP